jgi:hypothetical protein
MSRQSSTFIKKNDRVEALWFEDGKWYPAEVLQVNPYRIRFDGFVEEYIYTKTDLRVLEQGNAKAGGVAAVRRPPARAPAKEGQAAPAPAPAPPSVDLKHKGGSSDGKHGSTFKKNDRVEAIWHEDNQWYPAEVLQVKSNNVYRIRFDGFVEEYDRPKDDLRLLKQGIAKAGGVAAVRRPPARAPAKEGQAAPAPASAPPSVDLKHKGGSSDGIHGSTFKKNDRLEALLLEDGKWYPATVLEVKRKNLYLIRFDDIEGDKEYRLHDLRVLGQGSANLGGGAAASSGHC